MNETLMYFLKVNIAIALFYLFYRLFFAGDTFWKTRRYYMLFSVFISFIHPFLSVEKWLDKQESLKTMVVNYAMLPEFTVTPVQQINWMSLKNILMAIYALGAVFLLTKMLVQLVAILHMKMLGRKELVQGVSIIALEKEVTPFSFFSAIFMNPAMHNEHETREILAHELTHVRQWHSFDVLVSELLTIAFWFNPSTWLLKGEMRQNLEFLADNKVIESCFDSKAYQYHLLQLTYQTPEIKLTNKFNVSPLKKRIIMMNQKKSAKASLLKYSLIVPLALALVLSSNAQSVVNKAKKALNSKDVVTEQKTEKTSPNKTVEATKKAVETTKPLPMTLQSAMPANELTDPVVKTDVKANDEPFMVVEKMPQFPGGEKALMEYIGSNLKYPEDAMKKGEQGRLIIRFVVNANGKVEKTEVLRGLTPSMNAEALRVVNAMPDWIPGEQKGQKVSVYYTIPISFRLQGNSKPAGTMLAVKRIFVLDGKTMPLDFDIKSIKTESIASVDVLKPDTETKKAELVAKYGADAANGVILITCKK